MRKVVAEAARGVPETTPASTRMRSRVKAVERDEKALAKFFFHGGPHGMGVKRTTLRSIQDF